MRALSVTQCRSAAALLALGLGVSACGLTAAQYEAARRFGAASSTVGDFAAAEFPRMRDTTMALNAASVALGGEADPNNLQGVSTAEDLPPRVLAAEALAHYGRLLLALLEDTQAAELQAAADHFVSSASRATQRDLSDEQLQAAGKIVVAAGRRIVEYRKARAVKDIVPRYRSVIDELCELIRADFDPKGLRLAQGLHAAATGLLADADIALAEGGRSASRHAAAAEALRQADQARARLDVVYPNAIESLAALKKANAQLVAALADDRIGIDDVEAFAAEAEELHASAVALSGR